MISRLPDTYEVVSTKSENCHVDTGKTPWVRDISETTDSIHLLSADWPIGFTVSPVSMVILAVTRRTPCV